ncbi:beta-1,4-galactosyltransferase galt-1 [Hippoglossus stenolepis]|uniref:beta-1,4-galactosyltransferase galt-1 n=1 Tax=Hippoglossus stenolepis TaxID=195615 RepID=UPI001FAFBC1C|nr:beta-1,4-galactosyltransferase galt-1 [Hippoglossus stenolepis]XP_035024192.2 beta-1,4-galactosyltransferase galt-1 [Hippoglossus stenolepis]XP_035024193.2 beta-1,4-galactosyltransferase galt-1 [Hippoglossus stenolepis]
MDKIKDLRWRLFLLFSITFVSIFILTVSSPRRNRSIPNPRRAKSTCPLHVSDQTITPLKDTKHLLVSAFMDQRVQGFDIRIIGLFRIDSIQPLHCCFCCAGFLSITTPVNILQHPEIFGFPFVTTDVMCPIPENCNTTHVTLLTQPESGIALKQIWLPIRNRKRSENEEEKLQFNFTVCISSLFGDYNNVLQVAQTLEMYRLLGVGRVVIYNTSCGPELERLLQIYSQDGFLEIVPWPIHQHLNPSKGWLFSEHRGDVHYFGQLATLNECIYRSMERSRYVLLNDIDEIAMPYQHDNLMSLMNMLQEQHPNTGVFLIKNYIFPKKHFEPSGRFHLPQWNGLPGINIMEHIYSEDPRKNVYHPHKMIVQPRLVEQTSVHEVIKHMGESFKVPQEICRLIHVRTALQGALTVEQLNVDKRLWDFHEKLVPNVDKALKRAGLLNSEGQG